MITSTTATDVPVAVRMKLAARVLMKLAAGAAGAGVANCWRESCGAIEIQNTDTDVRLCELESVRTSDIRMSSILTRVTQRGHVAILRHGTTCHSR